METCLQKSNHNAKQKSYNQFMNSFYYGFFRRFRRKIMNKKTCAVVKAEEKQPCIPFGYHCKYGLQCKQIPVVEESISLRQLFYPANDQDYYGQYGQQPFENGLRSNRLFKRQTYQNDEYFSYSEEENDAPLNLGPNHLLHKGNESAKCKTSVYLL